MTKRSCCNPGVLRSRGASAPAWARWKVAEVGRAGLGLVLVTLGLNLGMKGRLANERAEGGHGRITACSKHEKKLTKATNKPTGVKSLATGSYTAFLTLSKTRSVCTSPQTKATVRMGVVDLKVCQLMFIPQFTGEIDLKEIAGRLGLSTMDYELLNKDVVD